MKSCVLVVLGALLAGTSLSAQVAPERGGRLTVGGYGEVALTRNFYSDNVYRYSHPLIIRMIRPTAALTFRTP